MADNDYNASYQEGRSGGMYTGGNSIDYAGYQQGQQMRADAEALRGAYSGGGTAVPMTLAQKSGRFGVFGALIGLPLGASVQTSIVGAVAGVVVGFTIAFLLRLALELVIRPFRAKSETSTNDTMGPLPGVLIGGIGGYVIGGAALGVGAAVVLLVVWMARNRR
ncbi:MAG: hypothetical protein HOP16_13435 [Acidobacteria bacterium]|nr:hypothetical protein [Acidobacteriota bacterium]